jgi:regulator of sirC expression with transglutaminase-like and TPR domain
MNKPCMQENKEINALLHLIDDPDEDVFNTVSERIISYGKIIIPNLENFWETSENEYVQERVEMIIHRVNLRDVTEELTNWKNRSRELLYGAFIVAKYQYPDIQTTPLLQEVEKIRRNIWLEMNSYLTPLEQANVINSILFNYYRQKGVEFAYTDPNDFLINKCIESKKGNPIANGILYLVLCQLLDIPVFALNIPRQFILGYYHKPFEPLSDEHPSENISFFIDPFAGQMYSHKEVEAYFKRINVPPTVSYYKPMSNLRIIQHMLEEMSKCFDNEKQQYKMKELMDLADLLDNDSKE